MTLTTSPVTIAGITLGEPNSYDADIDTTNEAEIVSRLSDLPEPEFWRQMNVLMKYLHSLNQGLVVDRYVTLLVKMAGRHLGEDATTA